MQSLPNRRSDPSTHSRTYAGLPFTDDPAGVILAPNFRRNHVLVAPVPDRAPCWWRRVLLSRELCITAGPVHTSLQDWQSTGFKVNRTSLPLFPIAAILCLQGRQARTDQRLVGMRPVDVTEHGPGCV